MRQILFGAVIATLIDSLLLLSTTLAQTVQLGVVKSPDNQGYWAEITARLNLTGVDYCIVDWSQVKEASDLGNPQVIFLPNIEQIDPVQLIALQEWIRQGGRTIVSGGIGVLSQPTIRNRLRSLLGAYWGFSLTQSINLIPLSTNTETWVNATGLAGSIQGGVIVSTSDNATTVAVWSQKENPPAVVATDKSTFLGWRWGVDGVASPEVDSAWLRASLFRYNINPIARGINSNRSVPYCGKNQLGIFTNNPPSQLTNVGNEEWGMTQPIQRMGMTNNQEATNNNQPAITNNQQPITNSQNVPDAGVLPTQISLNKLDNLTPEEISVMNHELEDLIGRFESTLLAANAANSNIELFSIDFVDKLNVVNQKSTGEVNNERQINNNQQSTTNNQQPTTNRIISQAKTGWQNFLNAVDRKDYTLAREYWFDTRRFLWDNYPINSKLAQPEIRAIWLDRGTIVKAKSEEDLGKIFDKLAAAGFNTIFFETVNASYPIYPSKIAPEQNPLVKGWDPLASAVKLAHDRGMELHAWVWMFAAANQRHNAILNQPDDYLGPLLTAHPDWVMYDREGGMFDPNTKKAFLDPANPEVRSYLISLLEEIVKRYQVDGIQLDYIRYPFQNPKVDRIYGYSQIARQEFQELTGVSAIAISPQDGELWQKWTDFRIRQIDSFVATVSSRLRQENPDLIISAAVFAIPRGERLEKIQQNWEDWAIRGDIDLVVPMTYALDTAGLETLAKPVLTQSNLMSALVLPGIRLLNLPDMVAVDQIQLLRDLPAGGYALFATENLNPNLQEIFQRTQGEERGGEKEERGDREGNFMLPFGFHLFSGKSSFSLPVTCEAQIAYRQPFTVAAARLTVLRREWSLALMNNQIVMPGDAIAQWAKETDALAHSLNQLAAQPSINNLTAARAALDSFQSQFSKWMEPQALYQPYQVQVWNYRLATIERLLSYGQRTKFYREGVG
ncbi:MAG TPA: hypothetical protein DEP38_12145, partial [Cyanobacteria bacterium UBA9226]|nr:hypothetical protein [Cyanobacteria bacterium UBA9226]